MSEQKIHSALASILGEVSAIGKNQKNLQQGFMFRGIDDVMNELHTLFGKYKVFVVPEVVDYTVTEKTTQKGSIIYYTRTKVMFHFTAEDGSEVVTTNVGEAMDSTDKGMNKTMSCALKYALMQLFMIPTKDIEDPDRVTPPETYNKPTATDELNTQQSFELASVLDSVKQTQTVEELQALWKELTAWQANGAFKAAVSKRKAELQSKAA